MAPEDAALFSSLLAAAALYAAVGHAGASGYLAVMTLSGFAPEAMRPTALALNLLVSSLGTVLFFRAGAFRIKRFAPLVAASIPAAFAGGLMRTPAAWFGLLVAAALAAAALRLALPLREGGSPREPGVPLLAGGRRRRSRPRLFS